MRFSRRIVAWIGRREDPYRIEIGPDGVPISDYGYVRGEYVGRQYSIAAVADKGLDYWNRFVCGPNDRQVLLCYDWSRFRPGKTCSPALDAEGRKMLLRCADWLEEHAHRQDGSCIWRYGYPSFYGTEAGWRSGHAQAEAIQLLLRAHALTGEEKYRQTARQALRPFTIPFEDGGVRLTVGQDAWWYLKFADANSLRRPGS